LAVHCEKRTVILTHLQLRPCLQLSASPMVSKKRAAYFDPISIIDLLEGKPIRPIKVKFLSFRQLGEVIML